MIENKLLISFIISLIITCIYYYLYKDTDDDDDDGIGLYVTIFIFIHIISYLIQIAYSTNKKSG